MQAKMRQCVLHKWFFGCRKGFSANGSVFFPWRGGRFCVFFGFFSGFVAVLFCLCAFFLFFSAQVCVFVRVSKPILRGLRFFAGGRGVKRSGRWRGKARAKGIFHHKCNVFCHGASFFRAVAAFFFVPAQSFSRFGRVFSRFGRGFALFGRGFALFVSAKNRPRVAIKTKAAGGRSRVVKRLASSQYASGIFLIRGHSPPTCHARPLQKPCGRCFRRHKYRPKANHALLVARQT